MDNCSDFKQQQKYLSFALENQRKSPKKETASQLLCNVLSVCTSGMENHVGIIAIKKAF